MRQFIKGTDGFSGAFAECLCGSPNLYQVKLTSIIVGYLYTAKYLIRAGYSGCFLLCEASYFSYLIVSVHQGGRKPWNSINFVCAHDGFTLADLVTYNNKNNLANGEENNDGENHNYSWNCGEVKC